MLERAPHPLLARSARSRQAARPGLDRGCDVVSRTSQGTPPGPGRTPRATSLPRRLGPPVAEANAIRSATSDAALRLFVSTATELLDQVEPLLEDPKTLAHAVMDVGYVFTYPAVCGRLVETFSLLALTEPSSALGGRATVAVATLAANHPGTARPPSDQFAAAILPTTAVLARTDVKAARAFVRKVSQWLLAPTNSSLGRLWTRSCWPRSPEPVTMSARSRSSWVRESRTTQADETWAQRAPGLASCGQQCPSAYWTSRCVALR
jgi:hypothetical protein